MKKITCVDWKRNKHEVSIEDLRLRPAIYGVIIKDGAILLSKQWDGYDFPGGGVKVGEDIKDALIREIKEETGMDAKIGKIITCENSFYKTIKGAYLHSILIYYLCEITGGELSIKNIDEDEKDYISMPEWIQITDINKIQFYNSVDSVEMIKKALEVTNLC